MMRMRDASRKDLDDLTGHASTHTDNVPIGGFAASMQLEEQVSCIPAKIRQFRPTGATASSSSRTQPPSTSPSTVTNNPEKNAQADNQQPSGRPENKPDFICGLHNKNCLIECD